MVVIYDGHAGFIWTFDNLVEAYKHMDGADFPSDNIWIVPNTQPYEGPTPYYKD